MGESSGGGSDKPFTDIQDEIRFEVDIGGNITPSWKLVRIATNQNQNLPLAATARNRSNYASIILGPPAKPQEVVVRGGPTVPSGTVPSQDVQSLDLSAKIGQSIINALPPTTGVRP
jgi:hypothetical protein